MNGKQTHIEGPATPVPGAQLPLDDGLEEIDTKLYHLQHTCALIGDFAGQQGLKKFTDGLSLETFAVVFGSISDQVRDVRQRLNDIQQELLIGRQTRRDR